MLQSILITTICAVGVSLAFAFYPKLTYRPAKPDGFGRIMIKPGPVSWLFGTFSLFLMVLFGYSTVEAMINRENTVFWGLIGLPLTALMGFSTFLIFGPRLRVCGAQVEYRGVKGWELFDWDDVQGVYANSLFGTFLHVKNQRPKPIWTFGYGSTEVRELFLMYEKPFELQ